jgi:hypothetical protein
MAGRGLPPKDPAIRRRRNTSPIPAMVVVPDGEVHGPELPAGYDWPERTQRWWNTWRTCAQASTLTDTDWDFLLDTATLHAALWSGNGMVAGELRLRVAKFGATPEDRARLRMQVGDPEAPESSETAPKAAPGGRYAHLRPVASA